MKCSGHLQQESLFESLFPVENVCMGCTVTEKGVSLARGENEIIINMS